MNHQDYLAAVERLRRVEAGEAFNSVYPNYLATMGGDKLTIDEAVEIVALRQIVAMLRGGA